MIGVVLIILLSFTLFDIPLDSWSLLVALGFVVGVEFARARAQQLGIRVADVVDGGLFIVGMGFIVGNFVHVECTIHT